MASVVTAKVNRPHSRFDTLSMSAAGTNMVSSISIILITGLATLFTVLAIVRWEAQCFALSRCAEPLIIITVLLIMTVMVSTSLNSASAPTEKLNKDTMVSALTSDIGTAT